jgi:uncharacterized repeat protein (TIGR01451 family)
MSRLALLLLSTIVLVSILFSTLVFAQEEEAAVEDSTGSAGEDASASGDAAGSQDLPFLFLHKDVSAADTTPGTPVTVTVTVKNVGAASAFDVVLTDKAPFAEEQTKKVEELAPGDNITIEYVVTPQSLGRTELPIAEASYAATQGAAAEQRTKVFSNEVREEVRDEKQSQVEVSERGFINVITPEELAKLSASHWKQYILYIILAAVAVAMPYYQARNTNRQIAMLLRDAKRSK